MTIDLSAIEARLKAATPALKIALDALNTISALPGAHISPNEIDNAKYLATKAIGNALQAYDVYAASDLAALLELVREARELLRRTELVDETWYERRKAWLAAVDK